MRVSGEGSRCVILAGSGGYLGWPFSARSPAECCMKGLIYANLSLKSRPRWRICRCSNSSASSSCLLYTSPSPRDRSLS
eukprot:7146213-Pyramimonas_sp.AAC.1